MLDFISLRAGVKRLEYPGIPLQVVTIGVLQYQIRALDIRSTQPSIVVPGENIGPSLARTQSLASILSV